MYCGGSSRDFPLFETKQIQSAFQADGDLFWFITFHVGKDLSRSGSLGLGIKRDEHFNYIFTLVAFVTFTEFLGLSDSHS